MERYLLIFFLFFIGLSLKGTAQDRVLGGRLTDREGGPLPGVNIVVKGTTIGTTSDVNGNYKIKAPLGATLVFSFIGFQSYEVKVTEKNSLPLEDVNNTLKPEKSDIKNEKKESKSATSLHAKDLPRGEAVLTDSSPTYVFGSKGSNYSNNGRIWNIYSIYFADGATERKKYGIKSEKGAFILEDRNKPSFIPFAVDYSSSFTFEEVNKLPKLQKEYAQGRPSDGQATWKGPETGEIFSWGPTIRNLEFGGDDYAFDKNGSLTARGTGNRNPAVAYNPYQFFRKGKTIDNNLTITSRAGKTDFSLTYGNRAQTYVIPNSGLDRDNINFKVDSKKFNNLTINYGLQFSDSRGKLLGRGANLASVMSAVYGTPATFDQANGLSGKQALKDKNTYWLADGMQRSASPGKTDNPYWLVSSIPDKERYKTLASNLGFKYNLGNYVRLNYSIGVDKQLNERWMGLAQGSVGTAGGRLAHRKEDQYLLTSSFEPYFIKSFSAIQVETGGVYDFNHEDRGLRRTDAVGFQIGDQLNSSYDSVESREVRKSREIHEVASFGALKYRDLLNLRFTNRSYYSTTYTKGKAFLPAVGMSFNFGNLNPVSYLGFISYGKAYFSYSRTVKESPLIYSGWNFNSTVYNSSQYLSYYESSELTYHKSLSPEYIGKFESGTEMNFFNGKLRFTFNYFNNLTSNAVVPILSNGKFELRNNADINNKGYEMEASFYARGTFTFNTHLSFTHYNPVVKKVYGGSERIPLAGFENVSTNLVQGQPYGVIYGTRYKRNGTGQLVIGDDGYPLVDDALGVVGNPNPDWIAGISNNLGWKNLSLAVVIDIRKGGDIWNGTQSALNYLGQSKVTQEQRNTGEYIYAGVREDGTVNSIAVDFGNPAKGIESNRWVKYGLAGVAEDNMEDASSIRLSEVRLTYKLSRIFQSVLQGSEGSISFIGKNLLLITRYSGVDPSMTLFGYQEGKGLDLFNTPATRTYGLSINLKI